MNETAKPTNQTDAPIKETTVATEADVLRAADAWQVEGFSVWEAVKTQMTAELPEPLPFRAEALSRSIYETSGAPQEPIGAAASPASENVMAELVALVRDLQNEVRELKQEVQGLKKQVAPRQLAPPTLDTRPATYPALRGFRATPAAQPPFPLFRD